MCTDISNLQIFLISSKDNDGINERIAKTLEYIKNRSMKRVSSIVKGICKSAQSVERFVKYLKEQHDLVEFVGSNKTRGYRLRHKGQ